MTTNYAKFLLSMLIVGITIGETHAKPLDARLGPLIEKVTALADGDRRNIEITADSTKTIMAAAQTGDPTMMAIAVWLARKTPHLSNSIDEVIAEKSADPFVEAIQEVYSAGKVAKSSTEKATSALASKNEFSTLLGAFELARANVKKEGAGEVILSACSSQDPRVRQLALHFMGALKKKIPTGTLPAANDDRLSHLLAIMFPRLP